MKKKAMISLITAAFLAVSVPCSVMAAGADAASEEETTGTDESAAEADRVKDDDTTAAEADSGAALSDDIYDFQMEMEGTLYQFPMSYADFTALGWTPDEGEDPEMKVTANSYGALYFNKGELNVRAEVLNLGVNEIAASECLIAGITIDEGFSDIDLPALNITLAKGILMGKSNVEEIKAAYGEPTDTYESDMYTKMTYEKDFYQQVELYVFKEENTLREVSMRNFAEPEGYDKGSVSSEAPDIVTAYTAPAELGTDMLEPVVEYCGDLYQLPCPVTALTANGWALQDVKDEDFVAGGSMGFVDMMKDNQKVRFSVYNLTENAVTIENCFVTELKAAAYDAEAITLKLSGDITLGADKDSLISAAKEKGYTCEDEENYLTIYKEGTSKLDNSVEFWFNKDESLTEAASITYRNEIIAE